MLLLPLSRLPAAYLGHMSTNISLRTRALESLLFLSIELFCHPFICDHIYISADPSSACVVFSIAEILNWKYHCFQKNVFNQHSFIRSNVTMYKSAILLNLIVNQLDKGIPCQNARSRSCQLDKGIPCKNVRPRICHLDKGVPCQTNPCNVGASQQGNPW